jgi:uncharacterized lipoprotein YddW (UPF0748 family)
LDYIRYPADCGGTACRHFFSPEDVSLTVEASYRQLKATAPDVQLTAATMSYGGKWHLQNWADWLAGEYIDYVMPMAYYDPDDTFGQGMTLEGDIERWQEFSHPERIVPGLKVFIGEGKNKVPKTSEQLLTQVKLCQTGGVKGMAIFDERSITEELLDALSSVTFSP